MANRGQSVKQLKDLTSQTTWPKVAIIVLNWNGWRDTIECLESISRANYENLEVIIVDNASMDGSPEKIAAWCAQNKIYLQQVAVSFKQLDIKPILSPNSHLTSNNAIQQLILIELDENTGFCLGNNIGMKQAAVNGAEFFLVLNNDTIVTPNFLKPIIEAAQCETNVGLVGDIICYANEPDKIWFAGGTFDEYLESHRRLDGHSISEIEPDKVSDTDWISGCSMLIPRRVYERVGGFYEGFFIWSEEWDYSIRVKKAGYRLVITTGSRIYHKIGHSLGVLKPLSYYYGTRNRLLLKRMYLPWNRRTRFMAWFLLSRIPRYLQFAMQGRWDLIQAGCAAIRDYLLGRTGKWRAHFG